VPKEIIWGHGGLWSDNSVAMFGALYRMHFPLNAEGHPVPSQRAGVPKALDIEKLDEDKSHSSWTCVSIQRAFPKSIAFFSLGLYSGDRGSNPTAATA
jgi:hypothetical protein